MTASESLRAFARQASSLRDTSYPDCPIVGGPESDESSIAEYVSVLWQRAGSLPTPDVAAGRVLAEALGLLMRSGRSIIRDGTHAAWNRLDTVRSGVVSSERMDDIIKLVNEEFLRPLELEWTSHGLKRTFRFWSDEEQLGYLRFCNQVIADLSTAFDSVCYAYGLVLSVVRNGDRLMVHDDDVDILVALPSRDYPDFDAGLSAITAVLETAGYSVVQGEGMVTHRWVSRDGGRPVDVFVALVERGTVAAFPGPRRGLRVKDVFPPTVTRIHGLEVPIPRDARTYVEKVYGPGWKVPRIVYSHQGSGWRDFSDLRDRDARSWRGLRSGSRWSRWLGGA